MQVSFGSKQFNIPGSATPRSIAHQIKQTEPGVNEKNLTRAIAQAVFGNLFHQDKTIGPSHLSDGILAIQSPECARLLGLIDADSQPQIRAPSPRVSPLSTTTSRPSTPPSPPPPPTSVVLAPALNSTTQTTASTTATATTDTNIRSSATFQTYIAPLLTGGTNFVLTTPSADSKLETGAYYNPSTNRVVVDQTKNLETCLDNLIFELCNAGNRATFAKASEDYDSGELNVVEYGQAYALAEFQTQLDYTDIIKQMKDDGETISPGATRALAWTLRNAPNYFSDGDASPLIRSFMSEPHDVHASSTDVASLPTPAMYSYQQLEKISGSQVLKRIEDAVGTGKLPDKFRSWARFQFPMKSKFFKRAKAYDEVLDKAITLLWNDSNVDKLAALKLSSGLRDFAALKGGSSDAMPQYR